MTEIYSQKSMKIETEEDVLQAMRCTDQLVESVGYLSNEQIFLRLVTEEAIVNALEYRAKNGRDGVEVFWNVSDQEFMISVKQPGTFFNINKKEGMNYGLRGRGMQLILNIMDEVWLGQEEVDMITLHMKKHVHEKN